MAQGLVPVVAKDVPWETRRHLQLLYQKLEGINAAIGALDIRTVGASAGTGASAAATRATRTGQSVVIPGSSPGQQQAIRRTAVGQYNGIPGRARRNPRRVGNVIVQIPSGVAEVFAPTTARYSYIAVSADYQIQPTDFQIDCVSGTFTVTLPAAAGLQGQVFSIKASGGGTITLATTGSETIDGAAPLMLTAFDSMVVMSTGSNWIVLSKY